VFSEQHNNKHGLPIFKLNIRRNLRRHSFFNFQNFFQTEIHRKIILKVYRFGLQNLIGIEKILKMWQEVDL